MNRHQYTNNPINSAEHVLSKSTSIDDAIQVLLGYLIRLFYINHRV